LIIKAQLAESLTINLIYQSTAFKTAIEK